MDYDKETRRFRDVWLLAIGAAMADETLRHRLVGYAPSDLCDLVRFVRKNDAPNGWAEMKKWGVTPHNGERAVERLFCELDRMAFRSKWVHVAAELTQAALEDQPDAVREKARQLMELFNGKA